MLSGFSSMSTHVLAGPGRIMSLSNDEDNR
jgi:hypothetical protein